MKQLAGLLVYYCPLLDEMSVVPFCSMGPILLTTRADFLSGQTIWRTLILCLNQ